MPDPPPEGGRRLLPGQRREHLKIRFLILSHVCHIQSSDHSCTGRSARRRRLVWLHPLLRSPKGPGPETDAAHARHRRAHGTCSQGGCRAHDPRARHRDRQPDKQGGEPGAGVPYGCAFQGRRLREQGRPACQGRHAPARGLAQAVHGHARADQGEPCQRALNPGALPEALQDRFGLPPDA